MKKPGGGVREEELWHSEIRMREIDHSCDRGGRWHMWTEHNKTGAQRSRGRADGHWADEEQILFLVHFSPRLDLSLEGGG